jgi:hypothetical protein
MIEFQAQGSQKTQISLKKSMSAANYSRSEKIIDHLEEHGFPE